jgi:hypothetical protein
VVSIPASYSVGLETVIVSGDFRGFPQSLQANHETVSGYDRLHLRSSDSLFMNRPKHSPLYTLSY